MTRKEKTLIFIERKKERKDMKEKETEM